MGKKGSVLVIILVLLILVSLALAGGGFYLLQQERAAKNALEEKVTELDTRIKSTEKKMQEAQDLASSLKVKLQDSESKVTTLTTDLQKEKAAKEEALGNIEQVKQELEQQKNAKTDLENKFNQAQESLNKAQEQLKALESQKSELETKIKGLETDVQSSVELGKIVVNPESSAPVASPVAEQKGKKAKPKPEDKAKKSNASVIEKPTAAAPANLSGEVLVLNKEYNFAVISLGNKDGVTVGQEFSVSHNAQYIGDIKIEKVHEAMSAAGFIADIKDKISVGDKVTQKGK